MYKVGTVSTWNTTEKLWALQKHYVTASVLFSGLKKVPSGCQGHKQVEFPTRQVTFHFHLKNPNGNSSCLFQGGIHPIEMPINPLNPNIHIQILQTDLYTFP